MKRPNYDFWHKDLPLYLAVSGVLLLGFAVFLLLTEGLFHYPWGALAFGISLTAGFWIAVCLLGVLIQVVFSCVYWVSTRGK